MPTPTPTDVAALEYAWKWFSYHADQRLRAFNYFLIIGGILLVAYFTSFQQKLYLAGILVAAFGMFMCAGFWMLDIRNTELVWCGRAALSQIEGKFGVTIRKDDYRRTYLPYALGPLSGLVYGHYFAYGQVPVPAGANPLGPAIGPSTVRHQFWLRAFFGFAFLIFLLLAILAIGLAVGMQWIV